MEGTQTTGLYIMYEKEEVGMEARKRDRKKKKLGMQRRKRDFMSFRKGGKDTNNGSTHIHGRRREM